MVYRRLASSGRLIGDPASATGFRDGRNEPLDISVGAKIVGLMKAYYARLKAGEGRSEAMRQVQLSMMAQPNLAPPYYWASFLVSGDWTTLDGKPVVPNLMRVQPSPRGCACAMLGEAETSGGGGAAWTAIVALGLGLLRRRAGWR